jgi:hypothetical protein
MESNKRIAQRQRVLKSGRVLAGDTGTFDVSVRDISATGAKLLCSTPRAIPDTIRLVMLNDGTMRPAKVMWRKEASLGIEFTGEAKQSVLRRT